MKKITALLLYIFLFQNNLYASNKENISKNLTETNNISFDFIQTIDGKDEKGECIIQYPKKLFCKYNNKNNKIMVSNGSSLVIRTKTAYYRYPIKSTPLELILDKKFLIKKIQSSKLKEMNNKYLYIQIDENNNNINIFFSKKNFNIVGWQIEDVYQNLSITYIFNTSVNTNIDNKIFKLPANH